ncbi:hypothetical protein QZH41_020402 [Actinostola sp. cb2023]|nr:hypothetical protein QZH41_020402 [Actinostola sp. cb2023]
MDTTNGFGYEFDREEHSKRRRSKRLQQLEAGVLPRNSLPRAKKRKTATKTKTDAQPRKNRPYQDITQLSLECCTEKTCLLNYGRQIVALIRRDFDRKLYEEQNNLLNSLVDVEFKTSRNLISYYIRDLSGLRKIKVCKKAFMKIFGIGKKRIAVLLRKAQPYSGDIEKDQRRFNRNAKTLELTLKTEIIEHIRGYEREQSHYAREKTRDKQFLASNLTIAQLWREFLINKGLRVGEDAAPVSYSSFRKIFRTFNLSFRKPYVDTCGKCDRLSLTIKYAKDEQERASAREIKCNHIEQADGHYDCINFDLNILPKRKHKEIGQPWIMPPDWK